jgi:hypothetical protein
MAFTMKVVDAHGQAKAETSGDSCELAFERCYEAGDTIVLETSVFPCVVRIQWDEVIAASDVWMNGLRAEYPIPVNEEKEAYPPEAFAGSRHVISAKAVDRASWLLKRKNLSVNPWDKRGETVLFPHCIANAETRGESVFAARNVIDGSRKNSSHGQWPYTSWGDNERPDARIRIEFGRSVCVDEVGILLRADFPHDNHWETARLSFSGGESTVLNFQKSASEQYFECPSIVTSWIELGDFTRDEADPSPFPALSEWDVFGSEVASR